MIALAMVVWIATGASPVDAGSPAEKLAALKSAARSLAKSTGCKQVTQCKALPLGSRSCGGPSEFLVYCAASTNEKKLKQQAKAATEAEKTFNAQSQTASICSVLTPPVVKLESGECKPEAPKSTSIPM